VITVIDYGRGNIFSIGQALKHLGAEYEICSDAARIADAECLILPGVGAFGDTMSELHQRKLVEPIRSRAQGGVPLLGICVGMQLLASEGEEFGKHQGLGLVPGQVNRLPAGDSLAKPVRVPNVGWRRVTFHPRGGDQTIISKGDAMVYFVHSFALDPDDPDDVLASIEINGQKVTAAVQRDNVVGYQFHPENSGEVGLDLIWQFLKTFRQIQ